MGRVIETKKLYKDTINEITKNEDTWLEFLKTAAWNFKYSFDDKILIYAQRPDATACAEMSEWNDSRLKRWVNKDAKAIFVFAKDENSQFPFRLVFDRTDTHNYRNTEYKLWEVKPEYEESIIETLEAKFGDINNKDNLAEAIIESVYNMVEDNLTDYMSSIQKYKKGSSLENLQDDEIYQIMFSNVYVSVANMIMTRCGIDPNLHIAKSEYSYINKFDSRDIITIFGTAVSDISEVALREIARTVANVQNKEKNKNHTFVKNQNNDYYNNENNIEGGIENGENRIHETRRLSNTKSSNGTREDTNREIRTNEIEISKEREESGIYNTKNEQGIEQTLDGDTENGNENGKTDSRKNGETRGSNRGNESTRPNQVDRNDEQLQIDSGGTSSEGNNLRLNLLTEEEQKQNIAEVEDTSVFSFSQEMIDSILQEGGNVENGKFRIYEQFSKSLSSKENIEFLKKEYGTGGRSGDKDMPNEWHDSKGIHLSLGIGDNEQKLTLTWIQVEKRIRELISVDRYFSEIEKDEYFEWLDVNDIPQVNSEIQNKINDEEYNLAKSLYDFIKDYDDYYYIESGMPIGNTDEQNIELIKADINDELNIKDYIDFLKFALEDVEFDDEKQRIIAKELIVKLEERLPYYEYQVGDTVYIGINEYFITAIDDERVALRDTSFPMFVEELERKDFDKKVKDNSSNEKLINERIIQGIKEKEEKYSKQDKENIADYNTEEKPKSSFEKWIDTFIEEKGIDLNEVIEIQTEENIHYFEIGNIIENIKATTQNEQLAIKEMLVKIDLNNGDVVEYFKELANNYDSEFEQKEQNRTTDIREIEDKQQQKLTANIKRKRRNKIEYFDLHPEIPLKERSNYKITDNSLGEGSKKEKYRRNVEAIKVLKICENENRYATPEEQEILSQYVGWGGIQEAFDKTKDEWTKEYQELSSLLTEKEYEEAKESTLTSFYTPPIVINSIYKALEQMGLERGNILEPSCRSTVILWECCQIA